MKKIIIILLALFTFTLVSCAEETTTAYDYSTDISYLQEQIDSLQSELDLLDVNYTDLYEKYDEMQLLLQDIGVIEGLNGQQSYYLPTAYSLELLGTELDKSKAPSYVLDEKDDYIPFSDVVDLLVAKYFGELITITSTEIGTQVKIRVAPLDSNVISQEEYLARMIFLINELSNYDFYIIGSTGINIGTVTNQTSWITIPMQSLRSEFITLTPEVIYTGSYEVTIVGMHYNITTVQALYDDFITAKSFEGYVLDY